MGLNRSNMADGSVDLAKMKGAELKKRGLPVDGKKNELVERLEAALAADGSFVGEPTGDDDADEDELLEGEDGETEEVDETAEQKLLGQKRPAAAPVDVISQNKKVCKLSKPAEPEPVEKTEEKTPQEKRAERFGIPASDTSKKNCTCRKIWNP